MSGDDLVISLAGDETITIEDFEDGDYGISLQNYITAVPKNYEYNFDGVGANTPLELGVAFLKMWADIAAQDPWEEFRLEGGGILHSWTEGEEWPFGEDGTEEPAPPAPQEGTSGDDDMAGTGANESIEAKGGSDTLEGGEGDDTLDGGTGSDTYIFNSGDGHDVISDGASRSYFFVPHVNTLQLGEGEQLSSKVRDAEGVEARKAQRIARCGRVVERSINGLWGRSDTFLDGFEREMSHFSTKFMSVERPVVGL